MNKTEKIQFIMELIANVQTELLKDIDKMPDDWAGVELRWLIAERFNREQMGVKNNNRGREYDNTILVNNL